MNKVVSGLKGWIKGGRPVVGVRILKILSPTAHQMRNRLKEAIARTPMQAVRDQRVGRPRRSESVLGAWGVSEKVDE
jgi:hypothetical protein